MDTIEYRGTVDKSAWLRGPWDNEVDKKQWRDEETGHPCLIVRGPQGGLCGYVGVNPGHPWYGVNYDSLGTYQPKPEGYDPDWYLDVHGGLTFSDGCGHSPDPSIGICHIPGEGEPDDVWWLGFDCAHYGDDTSFSRDADWRERFPRIGDGIYRDQPYVEQECAKLARQAAKAGAQ